jgi:hypothetical protein
MTRVEDLVIVELKSVERLEPVHQLQNTDPPQARPAPSAERLRPGPPCVSVPSVPPCFNNSDEGRTAR